MKKLVLAATVAAVAVAVPAQASKPAADRGGQRAEQGQSAGKRAAQSEGRGQSSGKSRRCAPRRKGYVAAGVYVSSALTQTKGADTPDVARDDRWSGTLTVDVKRTNHHAKADKGTTKVFTLTDAVVQLADRNDDGTRDAPVAGDRTKLQGKVSTLHKRCDQTDFESEIVIRKVKFLPPPSEDGDDAPPVAPTEPTEPTPPATS